MVETRQNEENIDTLLGNYLLEKPEPLIGAKTIQIILLREVLDYTALRTEESKELNSAATPLSVTKQEEVSRVAFLGSKQKAVESREVERMLRTAVEASISEHETLKRGDDEKIKTLKETKFFKEGCYLKDKLCMECPRCGLFGATALSADANIKHRIEYSTAFSLLPWDNVEDSLTFNAIDDRNIKTGQALGERYVVKPATVFPSIVTLRSVTKNELILAIKTLLSAKSYGAETRIGGDIRNHIVGIVAGWEEVITSLELTLELYDKLDEIKDKNQVKIETVIGDMVKEYKRYAANPDRIVIPKVETIVKEVQKTPLNKNFLTAAFGDIRKFREKQK